MIDFELACKVNTKVFNPVAGTTAYMAPDLVRSTPSNLSDLWAVGLVVIEMFSFEFPFGIMKDAPCDVQIRKRIHNVSITSDLPMPLGVPQDIWELIRPIFSTLKKRPEVGKLLTAPMFDHIRGKPFGVHDSLKPVRDLFDSYGMLHRPNMKMSTDMFKKLKRIDRSGAKKRQRSRGCTRSATEVTPSYH